MPSLHEIDHQIRRLTGESILSRPFLCDGSPLGCLVAQVGINPGTDTPFWPYWSPTTGFNKTGWLDHYVRKNGKLNPTRDRIEILCAALAPIRCLELNLYHRYSRSEALLAKEHHDTSLFDFMIKSTRPPVLVVHGSKPIVHLQRLVGITIAKGEFNAARLPGSDIEIEIFAAERHFAYVSRDYVRSIGALIKSRVQASQR